MIRTSGVLALVLFMVAISAGFISASERPTEWWMEGVLKLQQAAANEEAGEEAEAVSGYLNALEVYASIRAHFPAFETARVSARIESLEEKGLALGEALPVRQSLATQTALLAPNGRSREELAAILPVPDIWKSRRDPTGGVSYSIPLIETYETIVYQAFIAYIRKLERPHVQNELLTLLVE